MNILFIGDIVGKPGRKAIKLWLSQLKEKYEVDLTIANCENAAGGFGVTKEVVQELVSYGIDILTSGNHIWNQKEFINHIDSIDNLLRPANYPPGVPGRGWLIKHVGDIPVCVINLQGRVFMECIDCPFRKADEIINSLDSIKIVIVDFHAEATAEKALMGYYLSERVSAVIGTHTHVQTCDERILNGKTAFITDAGMTGPINSSIGMTYNETLKRLIYNIPQKFKVAKGPVMLNGVFLKVDDSTGECKTIERIFLKEEQ